jgi:glycosyltransferase involved in cell wall biosynthesis
MSRIAIIGSRGFPSYYGGFETLVRKLAPYLAGLGRQVTVYGHQRSSFQSHSEILDEIEVRFMPGLEGKSTSTLSFGLSSTVDAIRRDYDAVLILNVANGFFIEQLHSRGIPTAVNVDGMEWQRPKWNALGKWAFLHGANKCVRHADALVFDSLSLRQEWTEKFGRGGTFIPYGAPVLSDVPSNLVSMRGINPGEYILVVCRLVPENNVDLLLDALEYLPSGREVVVVGDSNYEHSTTQRIKALHEAKKVKWLGRTSDEQLLDQLWAHSALYWHGHSVGGTNPSLLQALGAGAPVLALDTVFNREVIGNDAQLVEPCPKMLAQRMQEVLNDDDEKDEMRQWGKEVIGTRYQWQDVCHAYATILDDLADSKH